MTVFRPLAVLFAAALCVPCLAQSGDPAAAPAPQASPHADAGDSEVVARVGDEVITRAQLDEAAEAALTKLRIRESQIRQNALEQMVARMLAEREARARGISFQALVAAEVNAKVVPVTEAEARAFYQQNQKNFVGRPEAQALEIITQGLQRQREGERRQQFIEELKRHTHVEMLLDAYRIPVPASGAPTLGPDSAPVRLIEFADFQCPYCASAFRTVKRLEARYGDALQVEFRNFPLSIHPDAPKAAEAAACAREQGKFWQMHDRLFESPSALGVATLKGHATELGLDRAEFDACLDSGRQAASWQSEAVAAQKLGVSSTPHFFVNGRPLVGAKPYEEFVALIDDELRRAGHPVPEPDTPEAAAAAAGPTGSSRAPAARAGAPTQPEGPETPFTPMEEPEPPEDPPGPEHD